jgi:nudix-type nucleoside diphosphatase (YffH/AdpP family)
MIEATAGLLDGDDPETCVIKEAEEESGFRVKKVEKVFEAYMSPGAVTEILHFYIAEYHDADKVSEGGGLAAEQEDITVMEVGFEKAMDMVYKGEIKDAKTIMLLQHLVINKTLK